MGFTHAVRFPVAILTAIALMGIVFAFLASVIGKHPVVKPIDPTKINFTRLHYDRPVFDDPRPPVRTPPPTMPDLSFAPPRLGLGDPAPRPRSEPGPDDFRIRSSGVDHDPLPTYRVNPTYPPVQQSRGVEGWVQLQFDITASGAVTNVVVIDAQPKGAFDAAATSAVARWKYEPMVRDGRAVERRGLRVVMRFDLAD